MEGKSRTYGKTEGDMNLEDTKEMLLEMKRSRLRSYVKSRDIAQRSGIDSRQAYHELQAAEERGWVSRWNEGSKAICWKIELDET